MSRSTEKRIYALLRQVDEQGYPVMSTRAIAERCGVNIHTVYNVRDRIESTAQSLDDEIRHMESVR